MEKTMEAQQRGVSLTPEERFEVFGAQDPAQYAEEAGQRWGASDAYRQSHRRTSAYRKADWVEVKAEQAQIAADLAEAMRAGHAPDSAVAMDAAEAHRRHLTRGFYDRPLDMHRGLADTYVGDERFTAHYEQTATGLAQYGHDAIHANADRRTP